MLKKKGQKKETRDPGRYVKGDFDISACSVDCFSWNRHGDMSLEKMMKIISQDQTIRANSIRADAKFDFEGKVVIDAGCGGGLKLFPMAARGAKLAIGIDGSAPALAAAQQIKKKLGAKNVVLINSFIEDCEPKITKLAGGGADFLLCAQVIHHTTDWRANLSLFHRLLKDDGWLKLVWVDCTIGFGVYNIRNKISYWIGKNKKDRMRIGDMLFSRFDMKGNKQKFEKQSYLADLYAAPYKIIPFWSMTSQLKKVGFEVVECYLPNDLEEWRRQRRRSGIAVTRGEKIAFSPFLRWIPTLALRIRNFLWRGACERILLCRKIS
jgi:2-polyprenyl-3-methyl-5-hydroxy-6-metoxy-1,4-benzoquinol methylase